MNPHATIFEILLRDIGWQPKARPIAGYGANGKTRCRDHIAAFHQPLDGFLDLVGRKILPERANQLRKALSALSYRGRERAIELAVKEELPVLGIEADNVGGQHIGGEIRRELQNVFTAVPRSPGLAMACHEVSTRILLTTPDHRRKAYSPVTRIPSVTLRWPLSMGLKTPLGGGAQACPPTRSGNIARKT